MEYYIHSPSIAWSDSDSEPLPSVCLNDSDYYSECDTNRGQESTFTLGKNVDYNVDNTNLQKSLTENEASLRIQTYVRMRQVNVAWISRKSWVFDSDGDVIMIDI